MIEDDKKEGKEGSSSNFKVIADMKAEQDYAVNVYKGSGEMSETFDKISKENAEDRKKAQVEATLAKIKARTNPTQADMVPDAATGEQLINSDSAAMYEFSQAVAAEASTAF